MDRDAAEDARQLALFDVAPGHAPAPLRRVAMGSRIVEYRFERRRRRTIGIRVDAHGVAVSAPRRASWREIEQFLRSSERWILKKLDEWAAAGKPTRLLGASGEALPLFGRSVMLEVRDGIRAVTLQGNERLLIHHPEPARHDKVRELLVRWLKARALDALAPRAAHYAACLGVPQPTVAISNARTQWGVCTEGGRLRLSWRLVHFEPALADYVVAHEAAHLVEMNHSKRFWKAVEALYPDWRAARKAVEIAGAALPIL